MSHEIEIHDKVVLGSNKVTDDTITYLSRFSDYYYLWDEDKYGFSSSISASGLTGDYLISIKFDFDVYTSWIEHLVDKFLINEGSLIAIAQSCSETGDISCICKS